MKYHQIGTKLLFAALLLLQGCGPAEPLRTEAATVLPQPKAIADVDFHSHSQEGMRLSDLKGKWSLVFFGYTRCPDVCPTELFTLAEMMRAIEGNPELVSELPQVLFVSVDPQRDEPEALQQYAGYYHASFLGVTAEQQAVDRFSRSMGAIYERVYYLNGKTLIVDPEEGPPEGLEDSYLINHSAPIFLLNPQGEMHAVFSTPHQPEVMIRDLAAIQSHW